MTMKLVSGDSKGACRDGVTFLEMRAKPAAGRRANPKARSRSFGPRSHRGISIAISTHHRRAYLWVDRRKLSESLAEIHSTPHPQGSRALCLVCRRLSGGHGELEFKDAAAGQSRLFGLMPTSSPQARLLLSLSRRVDRVVQADLVAADQHLHARSSPRPALYQRIGFVPYSREDRYIELP